MDNLNKSRLKKKLPYSLYAKIDWQKAAILFQHQSNQQLTTSREKHKYPLVKDFLGLLLNAADAGMIIATHAGEPGIESVLIGNQTYEHWQMRHIVKRLSKQKFVSTEEIGDGKTNVIISRQGRIRALAYKLDEMKLVRQKNWDKKWRVVIFDIPVKFGRMRDVFRMRLRQLGLYKLQESVYVSPFACFDEIEFLRELYGIPMTIRYLLAEKIEDDGLIRQYFHLS